MQPTTEGKALAITAGGLFAAGTIGILMEDVLLHDAAFTLKHALTLVVVGGTILVGHLASNARQAGHYLAMVGFGVLFLAGTLLTVYSSVGRQAEHTMVASAEVEAADRARSQALKGLSEAETMLAKSQAALAKECASGKGRRCDGIRATVDVYDAAVRGHKAELDKLGPAKVAVPEAKRAGELAAVFGADPVKIEAAMILVIPFVTTVFLELGAIICLGYGFRPSRKVSANDNAQTSFAIPDPPPSTKALPPVDGLSTLPVRKGEDVVDWSQRYFARYGEWPKLNHIEAAFADQISAGAFSRSTAYRRVRALKAA